MNHGSLFSGMGGFDLAAEWIGWENAFHCEWNPFGRKILNYYWRNAKSYEDITKTDFTIWRGRIDVLTGGFPCQPYSTAGKRKGKEDERHLWPEMLRAIREIKPPWVVGENVRGLISWDGGLVFDEVQADLEIEGYEVLPVLLPACGVNAPHRRDRIWFVAYSASNGYEHEFGENRCKEGKNENKEQWKEWNNKKWERVWEIFKRNDASWNASNSNSAVRKRWEGRQQTEERKKSFNKQFRGCNKLYRGNFEKFPSQPPVCNGDDGLSAKLDGITFPKWRSESIKAGGNAIVPQVAFELFKVIDLMTKQQQQ
jgi:DNA (cytosine-5)-methyltransferase 1